MAPRSQKGFFAGLPKGVPCVLGRESCREAFLRSSPPIRRTGRNNQVCRNLPLAQFDKMFRSCGPSSNTPAPTLWKATKEYLNQRGTKIRVFRVCFRAPFLPPFFPHFSLLFPLQALCILAPLLPSSPPPSSPLFLAPGKVRFGYPSDLGAL